MIAKSLEVYTSLILIEIAIRKNDVRHSLQSKLTPTQFSDETLNAIESGIYSEAWT